MRVLVVHPGANFSVADVYAGWVEGLRQLGIQADEYNLDARLTFYCNAMFEVGQNTYRRVLSSEQATELAADGLYGALYQAWPDVLLVISAHFVPTRVMDVARARGTKVVVVATESPYEDDRQLAVAEHVDLMLLDDPTNLERFRAVTSTQFIPRSYRPSLHAPGPVVPELECDLSFVGTGYASRIGFLEAMDLAGLDVLLAGNWRGLGEESPLRPFLATGDEDCLDNARTVEVYRSSRVGLNLYRREAERPELSEGWSMGPREIEMAACGLFFLRDPRPEGDELFPTLPTFTSPAEASEQLRWWLARPDARRDAAHKAREAVADRTFINSAAQMLRWLDKE